MPTPFPGSNPGIPQSLINPVTNLSYYPPLYNSDFMGDGKAGIGYGHSLSEVYTSLAAAQVLYPFARALTDSIDFCAVQLMIYSMCARPYAREPMHLLARKGYWFDYALDGTTSHGATHNARNLTLIGGGCGDQGESTVIIGATGGKVLDFSGSENITLRDLTIRTEGFGLPIQAAASSSAGATITFQITGHKILDGTPVLFSGLGTMSEARGVWPVTVVDADHVMIHTPYLHAAILPGFALPYPSTIGFFTERLTGSDGGAKFNGNLILDRVHIILHSDGTANGLPTTVATGIAAGTRTVTPLSMTGLGVGTVVWVGNADYSASEYVTITAMAPPIAATTFTAVFASDKSSGWLVNLINGTMPFWGNGCEDSCHYAVQYEGNLPVLLTQEPTANGLKGFTPHSDYLTAGVTSLAAPSMGHHTFDGKSVFRSLDFFGPALRMSNTNNVSLNNTYISAFAHNTDNDGATYSGPTRHGTYYFAIEVWNSRRFFHHGLLEGCAKYMFCRRALSGFDINIVMAGQSSVNGADVIVRDVSKPLFDITNENTASQGVLQHGKIWVDTTPAGLEAVPDTFFADPTLYAGLGGTEPGSSRLLGVDVFGGRYANLCGLPPNIAYNSVDVRVINVSQDTGSFQSLHRIDFDPYKQTRPIGRTHVPIFDGGGVRNTGRAGQEGMILLPGVIGTIRMPVFDRIGNYNGLGIVVRVVGMISALGATSSNPGMIGIDATVSCSMNSTNAVCTFSPAVITTAGSIANGANGVGSITLVATATNPAAHSTDMTLTLSAVNTGASGNPCYFAGTATMTYSGGYEAAPVWVD